MPAGGDDNQLGVGSTPNSFAGVLWPGGVRRGGVDPVYGEPGVVAPVGGWAVLCSGEASPRGRCGCGDVGRVPARGCRGGSAVPVVVTDVAAGPVVPGCCDWVGRRLG
jgi:hypothetical protein